MSTLRSALDEIRSSDIVAVADDELVRDLDELERAGRVIEAERGRRLAELERRGTWAADGHLSLAAWLADRHLVAHSTATARVRLGRAMLQMPQTAEALAAGEVSSTAATLLAAAHDSCPQAFGRSETALVEAARTRPVAELRRDLELWRHAVDSNGTGDEHERRFARRRLDLGPTLDGMVRVAGELDPETGQTVISALRAIQDAEVRETGARADLRTHTQRRADALGELCRAWLDRSDRPTLAGERPHVVVTVDLEALRRRDDVAELEDVGPVTSELARRLACDASVTRVVAAGRSAPLDVGEPDQGRPTPAPAGAGRPRSRVPVPGVRPATGMV